MELPRWKTEAALTCLKMLRLMLSLSQTAKSINYGATVMNPFVLLPLPRKNRAINILFTSMYLGSKYPEPLKHGYAQLADAMLQVLAWTGLPREILTDWGSVFMRQLMKEMCKIFGNQANSNPPHLQTDGYLEHWCGNAKKVLQQAGQVSLIY